MGRHTHGCTWEKAVQLREKDFEKVRKIITNAPFPPRLSQSFQDWLQQEIGWITGKLAAIKDEVDRVIDNIVSRFSWIKWLIHPLKELFDWFYGKLKDAVLDFLRAVSERYVSRPLELVLIARMKSEIYKALSDRFTHRFMQTEMVAIRWGQSASTHDHRKRRPSSRRLNPQEPDFAQIDFVELADDRDNPR